MADYGLHQTCHIQLTVKCYITGNFRMDKFLKNDFEKQQTQVPMQVESKDAMIIKINPWHSKISYPLYGT